MIPVCPRCSTRLRLDYGPARWVFPRLQFEILVFLDPVEIQLACFNCGWSGVDVAISLDTRTGKVILLREST